MKLSSLLDKRTIITNLRAEDKDGALKVMVRILDEAGKITDADSILRALSERETIDSTALGQGVAFPHARIGGLREPVALLAISKPGIDFKAKDGQSVHLFFLFLTPSEETQLHLQILSKALAFFFEDRILHGSIREAKTPQEVLSLLVSHELIKKEIFIPLPVEEIYKELGTSHLGLSEDEAKKRFRQYGPNVLKEAKKKSLFLRFMGNLYNLFAVLLWVGGILAFIAGMSELGWAIFMVILINAVFSFWQEYKAERALEALKNLLPRKVKVLREDRQREISATEIVPGDIVILEAGDSVSADVRLIESSSMQVDNSALTGESQPVYKTHQAVADGKNLIWTELPNLVFAGTAVTSGTGKAVVIATGMHTEIGRIASLTQELKEEKSPLQQEIEKVTKVITVFALTMGIIFFFFGTYVGKLNLTAGFIFSIGIIVANVPEGLLPTVTLSLAMAVQRMAKRNVLIKRLSSVETLGCTTVICTDKTGTLTSNQISVVKVWSNGKIFDVRGKGYEPLGDFYQGEVLLSKAEMSENGMYHLFDVAISCNNAELLPPPKGKKAWGIIGDPTEAAMLVMAAKGGVDIHTTRKNLPRIGELSFDPIRKMMTSINLVEEKVVAYTKGAPREILSLCTRILVDGKVIPITKCLSKTIVTENDSQAKEGLRVLAVAYRPLEFSEGFTVENTEKDLIFLGLIGMMDPPRPEVPQAIELCHRAGIRVIMITGDYGLTALSIAKRIGLSKNDTADVITGSEVADMDDGSLRKVLGEGKVVFARVSPEQKMKIVSTLKEMGEVVAVTGDGVNDAPSLKKADIGVAMGIRGSDVAKEAAAVVLTDDNFASIVAAIEEGRAVYANIRKFVTYIFSSNVPEIIPFIAFVVFKIPLPLTVMQILAVDLGTDLVPALALGTEPPERGIMDEPPRSRRKRLLDLPLLIRAYCFLGLIEAVACMAGFFFAYFRYGWVPGTPMTNSGLVYITATTMSLTGIVMAQIGNVFACRTETESVFKVGLLTNRLILWGILLELLIISVLIYVPFLQGIFNLAPIGLREWGFLFAFAPLLLLMEEGRKWLVRRWHSSVG